MIRSFLLSLLVFVVLVGAFALYWLEQPRVAVQNRGRQMNVPTTAPTGITQMQIGDGNRAWVNSYDKTGRLTSQFNADDYTPTGGNEFAVTKPVCIFYMIGGQRVRLTGNRGVVYVDPGKKSGGGFAVANASSPNRGRLKTVHIDLYPPGSTVPTQWMDTDNMAFDNDTLRIFTESYVDAAGNTVPADKVPVVIRGEEYEFDGQGLILRWNDRDARVQLLEIAHGDRLLVKDTKKVVDAVLDGRGVSRRRRNRRRRRGSAAAAAVGKPIPAVTAAVATSGGRCSPTADRASRADDVSSRVRNGTFEFSRTGRLTGIGDTLTAHCSSPGTPQPLPRPPSRPRVRDPQSARRKPPRHRLSPSAVPTVDRDHAHHTTGARAERPPSCCGPASCA